MVILLVLFLVYTKLEVIGCLKYAKIFAVQMFPAPFVLPLNFMKTSIKSLLKTKFPLIFWCCNAVHMPSNRWILRLILPHRMRNKNNRTVLPISTGGTVLSFSILLYDLQYGLMAVQKNSDEDSLCRFPQCGHVSAADEIPQKYEALLEY